jgi:hypothetical protein
MGLEMDFERLNEFSKELTSLLNRYSIDNLTNTPDFILSEAIQKYIYDVKSLNEKRDKWHGFQNLNDRLGGVIALDPKVSS